MKKEATVHMLPVNTGAKGPVFAEDDASLTYYSEGVKSDGIGQPRHLYFTTDEEIKEGEWGMFRGILGDYIGVYHRVSGFPYTRHELHYKGDKVTMMEQETGGNYPSKEKPLKIVATTNPELLAQPDIQKVLQREVPNAHLGLAKIPQSFIKQYVDSQGSIKKVMLEYDKIGLGGEPLRDDVVLEYETIQLKLNSSGEVIINPIEQKMYTRDEMQGAIISYISSDNLQNLGWGHLQKWFNKHYPE